MRVRLEARLHSKGASGTSSSPSENLKLANFEYHGSSSANLFRKEIVVKNSTDIFTRWRKKAPTSCIVDALELENGRAVVSQVQESM